MPPCDAHWPETILIGTLVSILVLVDAALRRVQEDGGAVPEVGFNPCFSGCRPATMKDE